MNELTELSKLVFLGNELRDWAIALGSFFLLLTVLPLARASVAKRLSGLHPGHQSAVALTLTLALLKATTRLFLIVVAAWVALRGLEMPPAFDRGARFVILVVLWLQVGLWASRLVRYLIDERPGREATAAEGAASLNILRFIGFVAVWIVAMLMLLANLGVEIMPLVAGLGIGGVAIALAVQNVLGDLLASLSIALDKPFRVGDFLIVGSEMGTVEHIGIKSTRLRSLTGEMIVLSNGDVLNSRVRNYKPMQERRITFKIGIVYETPRETVERVAATIAEAIEAQPKTRVDRVHFSSFGDFALIFEAVYYVLDADYKAYMDIQQAVNLRVMKVFEEQGIEFAYPTAKQLTVMLPAPDAPAQVRNG